MTAIPFSVRYWMTGWSSSALVQSRVVVVVLIGPPGMGDPINSQGESAPRAPRAWLRSRRAKSPEVIEGGGARRGSEATSAPADQPEQILRFAQDDKKAPVAAREVS